VKRIRRGLFSFGAAASALFFVVLLVLGAVSGADANSNGSAELEVAAVHANVSVTWSSWGTSVSVGSWPGGIGVWLGSIDEVKRRPLRGRWPLFRSLGRVYTRSPVGVSFISERDIVWLRPDGTPERYGAEDWRRWESASDEAGMRWSEPLPRWVLTAVPHWAALGVCALLPLLWVFLRSRSHHVRRRRRKLGLCETCGYDLAGNMSGKCSECGQPIAHNPGVSR
jgi:hypothetical protein